MRERLIIVSDLWGKGKSDWLIHYTQPLGKQFNLQFYDSCELARIDLADYSQDSLHHQFIKGGIEEAVGRLKASEKQKVHILAFSIGGSIAWRFGLDTDRISSLVCLSSTRLRKETRRPSGRIKLYYGDLDEFIPGREWFEYLEIESTMVSGKGHLLYRDQAFAKRLCEGILNSHQQR